MIIYCVTTGNESAHGWIHRGEQITLTTKISLLSQFFYSNIPDPCSKVNFAHESKLASSSSDELRYIHHYKVVHNPSKFKDQMKRK